MASHHHCGCCAEDAVLCCGDGFSVWGSPDCELNPASCTGAKVPVTKPAGTLCSAEICCCEAFGHACWTDYDNVQLSYSYSVTGTVWKRCGPFPGTWTSSTVNLSGSGTCACGDPSALCDFNYRCESVSCNVIIADAVLDPCGLGNNYDFVFSAGWYEYGDGSFDEWVCGLGFTLDGGGGVDGYSTTSCTTCSTTSNAWGDGSGATPGTNGGTWTASVSVVTGRGACTGGLLAMAASGAGRITTEASRFTLREARVRRTTEDGPDHLDGADARVRGARGRAHEGGRRHAPRHGARGAAPVDAAGVRRRAGLRQLLGLVGGAVRGRRGGGLER